MFKLANRVRETAQSITGTGTYNLNGVPSADFQTFVAGVGTGKACTYLAISGTSWEVCKGVVTDASPDTLTRDVVIASSTGGSKISWSSAAPEIALVDPAEQAGAMAFPGWVDGRYYGTLSGGAYTGTGNMSNLRRYASPFFCPDFLSSLVVSAEVTTISPTSGALIRIGAWRDNDGVADELIGEAAATVAIDGSTGAKSGTITALFCPGIFWAGFQCEGMSSAAAFRTLAGNANSAAMIGVSSKTDTGTPKQGIFRDISAGALTAFGAASYDPSNFPRILVGRS